MRIAAWMLVAAAAAATFWFGAVAAMLIAPPSDGGVFADHYYAVATARYVFPAALFALVNAVAALCLVRRLTFGSRCAAAIMLHSWPMNRGLRRPFRHRER
jgi:hypothetical protein